VLLQLLTGLQLLQRLRKSRTKAANAAGRKEQQQQQQHALKIMLTRGSACQMATELLLPLSAVQQVAAALAVIWT
jgi:hypothetical protein